jgi:SagB-type dehydrogenase family enzyme
MFPLEYHERTKHHFNRFALSAGYLDWASQPDPFRRYSRAPLQPLAREPAAPDAPYDALFAPTVPLPIEPTALADFLRCAMGLSAWKQYERSRWALRVNPSSGNLHPTETYIVTNEGVHHYAVGEHALERRCAFRDAPGGPLEPQTFLVALTSIFWREAWKYGERAFRYCQHDAGHALAALRLSAARLGWHLRLVSECGDEDLAALLGLDRDADFGAAEREAPECLALVGREPDATVDVPALVAHASDGEWSGTANVLSRSRRDWPIIGEVAAATVFPGGPPLKGRRAPGHAATGRPRIAGHPDVPARRVLLQRRSALAFDARSSLPARTFRAMLDRLQPVASPWDAIDWPPQVHLAIFVHRVDGLAPGLYFYVRDGSALDAIRKALRPDFLWAPASDPGDPNPPPPGARNPTDLYLLLPIDLEWPAMRVSCDQDIAGNGFFSLGMIARFEPALREHGPWFYRRLFWECGMIGQVLYLEAEAAGARATGIGCYYDDPVHELLGLSGHEWQSLYHFSMGVPVEDTRLTTAPGYEWEGSRVRLQRHQASRA